MEIALNLHPANVQGNRILAPRFSMPSSIARFGDPAQQVRVGSGASFLSPALARR
jgi:hypothetical protein